MVETNQDIEMPLYCCQMQRRITPILKIRIHQKRRIILYDALDQQDIVL